MSDYIFINNKWINCVLSCEASSSFEGVYFDHRIILAKIHLNLYWNKKLIVKAIYDWSSLTNCYIRKSLYDNCKKQADTLPEASERHTLNEEYENVVTAHLEPAAEFILTKSRAKCRVLWNWIVVREKWGNINKTSFLKRNPTDANVQNLKKVQRELTHSKKN